MPVVVFAILISLAAGMSDLIIVALMGITIPLFAQDRGRIGKAFSIRPLMWLGDVSFSIYLVQQPILLLVRYYVQRHITDPVIETVTFVLGTVSLTVAVSYVTNRWIERPAQDWSRERAAKILTLRSASR